MSAYSHRRQTGELPAGSGPYDAVAIPRAPRAPQYVPQMVPATGPYHAASASNRVPAPAHSLSPVAMASARNAIATGAHAAHGAHEEKARPSSKAGFAILLAGAIIGGLIGAVTHARDNAAEAFSAAAKAEMRADAQQNPAGDLPPPGAVAALPNGPLPSLAPPSPFDAKGDPNGTPKLDSGPKTPPKPPKAGGWTPPPPSKRVNAASSGIDKGAENAVTGQDEKPAKSTKKPGKKGDDDGYTVASAGSESEKPEPKPEPKAEKKKPSAEGDDAEKPTKKKSGKKGGGDAESVLRAAMGATENSL